MVEFVFCKSYRASAYRARKRGCHRRQLARILKHLGYNAVKEYYLNDVGNQMNVLGESTKIRYRR
jgi:hypothetical protein